MSTIKQLGAISRDLHLLSALEKNERIEVKGNVLSRTIAADRFLRDAESEIGKLIHKVVTLALKIIQALKRLFTGETAEKELDSLSAMVDRTKGLFNAVETKTIETKSDGGLPPLGEEIYGELNALGEIDRALDQVLQREGINNYRECLESGSPSLFPDSEEARSRQRERVDDIQNELKTDLAPRVKKLIDSLEKRCFGGDVEKVKGVFDRYIESPHNREGGDRGVAKGQNGSMATKAARYAIGALYGEGTVEKALLRTGLEKKRALSEKELQIVLTSILANLTIEDVKEIYAKRENPLLPLSSSLRNLKEEFDELSEEQICRFMGELLATAKREIPLSKSSPQYEQLRQDEAVIHSYSLLKYYDMQTSDLPVAKEIMKYSYTEYLSRYIAYALFKSDSAQFAEGVLIPIYDESGKLALKKARTVVSDKGLHCLALEPLFVKEGETPDLSVIFRGTYSADSIKRDLNFFEGGIKGLLDGPGRHSFASSQEKILSRVEELVNELQEKSGEKVSLKFIGHSLGASDTERIVAGTIQRGVERADFSKKIGECNLFAYNAPSIETDITSGFIDNLKGVEFDCTLRYFDADGDPVQQMGPTRLGYVKKKQKEPKNLKITRLLFNRNLEEKEEIRAINSLGGLPLRLRRAAKQHTAPFFSSLNCPDKPSSKAGKKNHTFIEEVISNNREDGCIKYGEKMQFTSHLSEREEINRSLFMPMGFAVKKINRLLKKRDLPPMDQKLPPLPQGVPA